MSLSHQREFAVPETKMKLSVALAPAEPLWKVAPTRDNDGGPVSDLLMIIPKLKHQPDHYIKETLANIEFALTRFSQDILFANVDMKLNTLWVSFRAVPGVYSEIVTSIRENVPEALLVADMSPRMNKR